VRSHHRASRRVADLEERRFGHVICPEGYIARAVDSLSVCTYFSQSVPPG